MVCKLLVIVCQTSINSLDNISPFFCNIYANFLGFKVRTYESPELNLLDRSFKVQSKVQQSA
jgi:hypothetical protein